MKITSLIRCFKASIVVWVVLLSFNRSSAQPAAAPDAASTADWTAAQDHQNMLDQLGIKKLRPGPSGRAGAPNSANYDPEKANPYPDLPDPLLLKNGQKITTPEMWLNQRRAEIVEDFE